MALAQTQACQLVPRPLLVVTEGIEGGIAPRAVPFQLVIVPGSGGSSRLLVLRRDAKGTPTYTQGRGPDLVGLQKELDGMGLYALPQEKEPGLSDPYGMAIALHSHDGQRCWVNAPPTGCVLGTATVKPTREQKATFAGVVKRLEKLAAQATEPLAEEEYLKSLSALYTRQ